MNFDEQAQNHCKQIVEHFGASNQVDKSIEEIGELLTEIGRYRIGQRRDVDRVVSEIADVMVMLTQLSIIFGTQAVEREVEYKLQRAMKRVANEKEFLRGKNEAVL